MKVPPKTERTNGATIGPGNSFPIKGRCQSVQIGARIRLAISGEYFLCNCGRANPRQPGSSPSPMNNRMKRKRSGTSRRLARVKTEIGERGRKQSVIATAMRQIRTGAKNVIVYHLMPTRHRTRRAKNSRRPDRPWTIAVMMMAATKGPRGFGPVVWPRNNARIQGYQERTKAITKNAISRCRCRKAFMLPIG